MSQCIACGEEAGQIAPETWSYLHRLPLTTERGQNVANDQLLLERISGAGYQYVRPNLSIHSISHVQYVENIDCIGRERNLLINCKIASVYLCDGCTSLYQRGVNRDVQRIVAHKIARIKYQRQEAEYREIEERAEHTAFTQIQQQMTDDIRAQRIRHFQASQHRVGIPSDSGPVAVSEYSRRPMAPVLDASLGTHAMHHHHHSRGSVFHRVLSHMGLGRHSARVQPTGRVPSAPMPPSSAADASR